MSNFYLNVFFLRDSPYYSLPLRVKLGMRSPNNLVSMCNLFGLSEDVGPLVNIGLLAKQFWLVSAEQSINFNIPIYASDYTLGFIPKMDTSEKGISVPLTARGSSPWCIGLPDYRAKPLRLTNLESWYYLLGQNSTLIANLDLIQ